MKAAEQSAISKSINWLCFVPAWKIQRRRRPGRFSFCGSMANVVVLSHEIPIYPAGLARVFVSPGLCHTAKPANARRDRLGEEGSARLEYRGRARPLDRHPRGRRPGTACSRTAVFSSGLDGRQAYGVHRGPDVGVAIWTSLETGPGSRERPCSAQSIQAQRSALFFSCGEKPNIVIDGPYETSLCLNRTDCLFVYHRMRQQERPNYAPTIRARKER